MGQNPFFYSSSPLLEKWRRVEEGWKKGGRRVEEGWKKRWKKGGRRVEEEWMEKGVGERVDEWIWTHLIWAIKTKLKVKGKGTGSLHCIGLKIWLKILGASLTYATKIRSSVRRVCLIQCCSFLYLSRLSRSFPKIDERQPPKRGKKKEVSFNLHF